MQDGLILAKSKKIKPGDNILRTL